MTQNTKITILFLAWLVGLLLFAVIILINIDDTEKATVDKVIDGDTLVADGQYIRLADVDTPEKGEAGYQEAKNYMMNYLGKEVKLNCRGKGHYNRHLCEVYYNGKQINQELLDKDLAELYNK